MTPEEILANIEALSELADRLDSLKTNLEHRGWSTPASEQASIVMTNTMMMGALIGGTR